jgi:hypothetical protein
MERGFQIGRESGTDIASLLPSLMQARARAIEHGLLAMRRQVQIPKRLLNTVHFLADTDARTPSLRTPCRAIPKTTGWTDKPPLAIIGEGEKRFWSAASLEGQSSVVFPAGWYRCDAAGGRGARAQRLSSTN